MKQTKTIFKKPCINCIVVVKDYFLVQKKIFDKFFISTKPSCSRPSSHLIRLSQFKLFPIFLLNVFRMAFVDCNSSFDSTSKSSRRYFINRTNNALYLNLMLKINSKLYNKFLHIRIRGENDI